MFNQPAFDIYLTTVFGLAAIAVLLAVGTLVYLVADQLSHSHSSRPAHVHSRRPHAPRLNHPVG